MNIVAKNDLSNVLDELILNKLKNVDGSGSGLDADLVRGLPADFTSSLASAGYQKLPSGLIIQWGYKSFTNTRGLGYVYTTNVTFPISFPSVCYQVFITPKGFTTGGESIEHIYSASNITLTGFTANCCRVSGSNSGSEIGYFCWLAIGY
jgi:hypothetical protein